MPHLLTQVVVDPKKAANALRWAVTEMERRYDLLAEAGMRDITGYNEAVDRGALDAGPEAGITGDGDLAEAGVEVDGATSGLDDEGADERVEPERVADGSRQR